MTASQSIYMPLFFASLMLLPADRAQTMSPGINVVPQVLHLGRPVEQQFRPKQRNEYSVKVAAGMFVRIAADQKGVDIVLRLFDPESKLLMTSDAGNGTFGPEVVSWIAKSTGTYRVVVTSERRGPGSYIISLSDRRYPSDTDRIRVQAERALFSKRSFGSMKKDQRLIAIRDLQEAVLRWRQLAGKYEEALCLLEIAEFSSSLSEKQTALDYVEKCLSLSRAVGSQSLEAVALIVAGRVYFDLGDSKKALSYYEHSFQLRLDLGDRFGQAVPLHDECQVHLELGQADIALEFCQRALSIEREDADKTSPGATLEVMGNIYSMLGDKRKALTYLSQAISLSRDDDDRLAAIANRGVIHFDLGEPQSALKDLTYVLKLARAFGEVDRVAGILCSLGMVKSSIGDNKSALNYFQEALPLTRAAGNRANEALALNNTGAVYYNLGQKSKALEFYTLALPILREVGSRGTEAEAMNNVGMLYSALGEKQKALTVLNDALTIAREIGFKQVSGASLNNIGGIYAELGDKKQALDYFNQALPILHEVGNQSMEGTALNNIGEIYSSEGEKTKALALFHQALPILRKTGNRQIESTALDNMGMLYSDLGDMKNALEYLGQSLKVSREIGSSDLEASVLNDIGTVYDLLGEKQMAMDYLNQSLIKHRDAEDKPGAAMTLCNIGIAYAHFGDRQKALEYMNEALTDFQKFSNKEGEGSALESIGGVNEDLGETQEALNYYNRALTKYRATSNRSGEASTLNNIGIVFTKLADTNNAIQSLSQAIFIERAIGDRFDEVKSMDNLSLLLENDQPDVAIALSKKAVSALQSIRSDNRKLGQSLLRSYEKSIYYYYRRLAGLLVDQGRLQEAENVLGLLKTKEAAEFVKRDEISNSLKSVSLRQEEQSALSRYDQIIDGMVALAKRQSELDAKKNERPLSDDEVSESDRNAHDLSAANLVLHRFFDEQEKRLALNSSSRDRVEGFKEAAGLGDQLRKLGPDVVAIYTLVLPDKYVALLITSGTSKAYVSKIQEQDLNKKILDFREALQDADSDPVALAQDLYHVVFPAGLRGDLDSIHTRKIMWSIDGNLRYIPFAALHDGKDYLVHLYDQSIITPLSIANLNDEPAKSWSGVGFGVSEGKVALPSVPAELHGIFREAEGGQAPLAGSVRLNRQFTRTNFTGDLHRQKNLVVHIATHFDTQPGVEGDSELLLGDGKMTLAEIDAEPFLFRDVELLTLSACNTAFANKKKDGSEIDSFGFIAQRLGAKAVIASLWSVEDSSTATLMQSLYTIRQNNPGMTKTEALRQAQDGILSGKIVPHSEQGAIGRNWRHPYFWAPFILIGNWK